MMSSQICHKCKSSFVPSKPYERKMKEECICLECLNKIRGWVIDPTELDIPNADIIEKGGKKHGEKFRHKQ